MTELARWKGEGDRMDVSMFLDGLEMEVRSVPSAASHF